VPQNYAGGSLVWKAVAEEQALAGWDAAKYAFLNGSELSLAATGAINMAPTLNNASGSMSDALRNPSQVVSGNLVMQDADNDALRVSSLKQGETLGTEANDVFTINGAYGTLTLDAQTGAYSYTLAATPPDGYREQFDIGISDGNGGTASGTLTVVLNAPNNPPEAQHAMIAASGVAGTEYSGSLDMSDPNGDNVAVAGVEVNGQAAVAAADGSYTLAGLYGTFVFRPDGSYTYTLMDGTASGIDVLSVVLQDEYGASSTSVLNVNVGRTRAFSFSALLDEGEPFPPASSDALASSDFTDSSSLPASLALPSSALPVSSPLPASAALPGSPASVDPYTLESLEPYVAIALPPGLSGGFLTGFLTDIDAAGEDMDSLLDGLGGGMLDGLGGGMLDGQALLATLGGEAFGNHGGELRSDFLPVETPAAQDAASMFEDTMNASRVLFEFGG
jgi:hypothetical protein